MDGLKYNNVEKQRAGTEAEDVGAGFPLFTYQYESWYLLILLDNDFFTTDDVDAFLWG